MHNGLNGRRKNALSRLEEQLEKGTKLTKVTDLVHYQPVSEQFEVPLTDGDKDRIKSEIKILKSKIANPIINN